MSQHFGNISRSNLLIFSFLIVLSSTVQAIFAQSLTTDNIIKVKFADDFIVRFESAVPTLSSEGIAQYGIEELDSLNTVFGVSTLKRVFPYSEKFNKRHRDHGLHRWYEVRLNTSVFSPMQCASSFENCSFISHAETVLEKDFNDGWSEDFDNHISNTVSPGLLEVTDDPLFDQQWHYNNTGQTGGTPGADIDLQSAWDIQMGRPEVLVAIIDGGLDVDHEDLISNVWINEAEKEGVPGVDDDGNGYIDDINGYGFGDRRGQISPHYHGVHVGGTISAMNNNGIGVSGIAGGSSDQPGVQMMSCAVFGTSGNSGFDQAFVYAADNGAVIAQNSWGYTFPGVYEQSVLDAIDYFIENAGYDENGDPFGPMQGGIVIFAAGNANSSAAYYPGYYEPVLSVASTDYRDIRSTFSNYGSWVDIAAPGTDVLSTYPNNSYNLLSGTSMACPHVSGVAGLIVSQYGQLGFTPDEVRTRLIGTVDNIDDLNPNYVGLLGTGRLNAYNAVLSDTGEPPNPINDLSTELIGPLSVTLEWTATGANGDKGRASIYDIRYAEFEITEDNFETASIYDHNVNPAIPGQTETLEITGLSSGTAYYFAIKARNFFGNQSSISNVVEAKTKDAPNIGLSKDSLLAILDIGADTTMSFIISNSGQEVLTFDFFEPLASVVTSIIPSEGSVDPGQQVEVDIAIATEGLLPDNHWYTVRLENNDPKLPQINISLLVHVNGEPRVQINPEVVDFDTAFVGFSTSGLLSIANVGNDSLHVFEATTGLGFGVENHLADFPMSILPGETKDLRLTFSPNTAGSTVGVLQVRSNDPNSETLSVDLQGFGILPPEITIQPDTIIKTLFTGEMVSDIFNISNVNGNVNGGSPLNWNLSILGDNRSVSVSRDRSDDVVRLNLDESESPTIGNDAYSRNIGFTDLFELPYLDDFEDGNIDDWKFDGSRGLREVTNITSAKGEYSFYYKNEEFGHLHGISQTFEAEGQPENVSFYVRSGSVLKHDSYFVLASGLSDAIFFYARADGRFYVNADVGGDRTFEYTADQWYRVSFLDIDWDDKDFDYYVDDVLIKADVPFRHGTSIEQINKLYLYSFDLSEAWWDEINVGDANVSWLTADIEGGVILPGSSQQVNLVFDATGLDGGLYPAVLELNSNDPGREMLSVGVGMTVTGSPDIDIIPNDAVSFGNQFINIAVQDTLTIQNRGTDRLIISSVDVNNSDFTISLEDWEVLPRKETELYIDFTPSEIAEDLGVLTVSSNDPDQENVLITLSGNGIGLPVMGISPDSLGESLLTGQTKSASLTIDNSNGLSLLDWDLQLKSKVQPRTINGTLIESVNQADYDVLLIETLPLSSNDVIMDSSLEDPPVINSTGGRLFVLDYFDQLIKEIHPANGVVINSFTPPVSISGGPDGFSFDGEFLYFINAWASNNIYKLNASNGEVIASIHLSGYALDGLASSRESLFAMDYSQNKIFEIDFESSQIVDVINVNQFLVGGLTYGGARKSLFASNSGQVIYEIDVDSKEIVNSFVPGGSIYGLGYSSSLDVLFVSDVSQRAIRAVNPNNGATLYTLPIGYFSGLASDESAFVSWLTASVKEGQVEPGALATVDIGFNASGLNGGLYEANIRISSNDPVNSTRDIPVGMEVIGAPEIVVSKSAIDFGALFIGLDSVDFITVHNNGTDSLKVSDITVSNADYSLSTTSFTIAPKDSMKVSVSYVPSAAEDDSSTMTLFTNDPDDPEVAISLIGIGLLPPDISLSPDTLGAELAIDETVQQMIQISNSGGSDLNWSGSIVYHYDVPVESISTIQEIDIANSGQNRGDSTEAIMPFTVGEFIDLPDSPVPLTCLAIDERGENIYGQQYNGTDYYVFNIPSRQWSSLTSSPIHSRGAGSATYLGDKIYSVYESVYHMAVYDVSLDTWETVNLNFRSGVVANDGVYLYLVDGYRLKRYSLTDGEFTDLAQAPFFIRRGSLSYYDGNLYSHYGYSYTNFAKYEIGSDQWQTLPRIPRGAVMGSTVDPIAGKYYAYGRSGERYLYEYDISNATWSTYQIPYFDVRDGGLVYSGRSGLEGVYFIAGTSATGFARMETKQHFNWLQLSQVDGTISPDDISDLSVSFDAIDLIGGLYRASLKINSNDPLHPALNVPIGLQVTGVPSIMTSESELNYGEYFVGSTVVDSIHIRNIGTGVLEVADITIPNADYHVSSSTFEVAPFESEVLYVVYKPTGIENDSSALTIHTNDQDHPEVLIHLRARGIAAPSMTVNPDTIGQALLTNETIIKTLTIDNKNGGNDLIIESQVQYRSASVSNTSYRSITVLLDSLVETRNDDQNVLDTTILVIQDRYAGNLDIASYVTAQFGVVPTKIQSSQLGSINLSMYDLIITAGFQATHYYDNLNQSLQKLEDYVYDGGTIQYLVATSGSNVLLPGGGIMTYGDWQRYNSVMVADHPITQGLPETLSRYQINRGYFSQLPVGTTTILQTTHSENPTLIEYAYGFGKVIATSVIVEYLHNSTNNAAELLNNMTAYTISESVVDWLKITSNSVDTIPAGTSTEMEILFDASQLIGGIYEASIDVFSNDPLHNLLSVPVGLEVTGAADIEFSEELLNYGDVFIGNGHTDSLEIRNIGSEDLEITSITIDNPDFNVDISSTVLSPQSAAVASISYYPTRGEIDVGNMKLLTNDPDAQEVYVSLRGRGLDPPNASISPDSIGLALSVGDSVVRSLTIDNRNGGSDLIWSSSVWFNGSSPVQPVSAVADQEEYPSHSMTDLTVPMAVEEFELLKNGPDRLTCVAIDIQAGKIYAQQTNGSRYYEYDIVRNEWRLLTNSPINQGRIGGAVYLDGKIYSVYVSSSEMAIYDISMDTWQLVQLNASTGSITTDGQDIYILTGTRLIRYTVANAEMTNLMSAPFHGYRGGLSYFNGHLYGHQGDYSTVFARYSVELDQWEMLSSLPSRVVMGSAIDDEMGKYYTYGSQYLYEYDILEDSWSSHYIPYFSVRNGGLVYNGYGHKPGVYFVAGEYSTSFAKYNTKPYTDWMYLGSQADTVRAGEVADLSVSLISSGLYGGLYEGDIMLATNDPASPSVRIPVGLDVTGTPDVWVSRDKIEFGNLFLHGSRSDTVVLRNEGTDHLTISSITVDGEDFNVSDTSFVLAPEDSILVAVTYKPTTVENDIGVMTVSNDDPDENEVKITLSGSALEPPRIALNPDSLSQFLFLGQSAKQILTIDNINGGSDLIIEAKVSSKSALEEVNQEGSDMMDTSYVSESSHTISNELEVDVLVIQNTSAWGLDMTSFLASNFGVTATRIRSYELSTTDLSSYDLLITVGDEWNSYYTDLNQNLSKLESFVTNGGVIQYQLAAGGANVNLVGGARMVYGRVETYNRAVLPEHPIVQDLSLPLGGSTANLCYLSDLPTDALIIAETFNSGHPTLVEYGHGAGWIVASGMPTEYFYHRHYKSKELLPKMTSYCLEQSRNNWIRINSDLVDTIQAGSSGFMELAFDASRVVSGTYKASIDITTNDPLVKKVSIPVHLEVEDYPKLELSQDELDFGTITLGQSESNDFSIHNNGLGKLVVSQLTINHPDFSVLEESMLIDPGGEHKVSVTYKPTSAGEVHARLSIHSNDTLTPVRHVDLLAESMRGADMHISPDSVWSILAPDSNLQKSITIDNSSGDADLIIEATLQPVAANDLMHLNSTAPTDISGWVRVTPLKDTVKAGLTGQLNVIFDSHGVNNGLNKAYLQLSSNSVSNPSQTVPITMYVSNQPKLRLFDTAIDFGQHFVGANVERLFDIQNIGAQQLEVTLELEHPTLSINQNQFVLESGEITTVELIYNPIEKGTTAIELAVQTNDPDQPEVLVPVFAEAIDPPKMNVSISGIIESLIRGNRTSVDFSIDNIDGKAELEWQATGLPSWLGLNATSGTVLPGHSVDMTATISSGSLLQGSYTGSLVITSNDPVSAKHIINMTVNITDNQIFTLREEEIVVASSSGDLSISVSNNDYPLNVSSNRAWLQVGEVTNRSIDLAHEANPSFDEREAHLTIRGLNNTEHITVIQGGVDPYLSLSKVYQGVGDLAGNTSFVVNTNISGLSVNNAQDWLSVTLDADGVTLNYTTNLSLIDRSDTITFSGRGLSKSFVIVQNGALAKIELETDTVFMAYEASSSIFHVSANFDEIIASSETEWLDVVMNDGAVTTTALGNPHAELRYGKVLVHGHGVSEEVVIAQSGRAAYIDLSEYDLHVDWQSGVSSVWFATNVKDYNIFTDDPWVRATANEDSLFISYDPNPGDSLRSTTVSINAAQLKETISITQDYRRYLDVEDQLLVSSEGGIEVVGLSTNLSDLTLVEQVDFLNATILDDVLEIEVAPNLSIYEREGWLVLGADGLMDSIAVMQSGANAYIELSADSMLIDAIGGTFSLSIMTNEDALELVISSGWLLAAIEGSQLVVNYEDNPEEQPRLAEIDVSGASSADKLIIAQAPRGAVLGLQEPSIMKLVFYPNPTPGIITIPESDFKSIEVVDMSGRRVPYTSSVVSEGMSVDLLQNANGLYHIYLTRPDGTLLLGRIILKR